MGSSESINKNKETNKKTDIHEFNFCVKLSFIKSVNSKYKEKNELLLFKTYAYPKVTNYLFRELLPLNQPNF